MASSDSKPGAESPKEGVASVVTSHERPSERPERQTRPSLIGIHAGVMTPTPIGMGRLGRYQIITKIATGGMAEVYLAVHGELSGFRTPVVVKRVLPHLACNQQFIDMFLDEARIASLLDHPNVVRIYEVGRSANEYFLAMELVQGRPLSTLIRRHAELGGPLETKIAAFIVAQAAHGLHHAHELKDPLGNSLGLVHRDVSPQNLLVSFEGSVKVIDFGIARALGRITDTQTGGMKGKFGYMSPEQARGEEVDRRTDIFALGVILWEAVCGRRLFYRDNDLATMRALVYDPIAKPSTIVPVAPELESIIMRALARSPKLRFQTAAELGSALEKFVALAGGTSTHEIGTVMKTSFAQEITVWQQTMRSALSSPTEPEPTPTLPPTAVTSTNATGATLRDRWPIIAAAVGGALVVSVLAVALMRTGRVDGARSGTTRAAVPSTVGTPGVAAPRIEQIALPAAPAAPPAVAPDTVATPIANDSKGASKPARRKKTAGAANARGPTPAAPQTPERKRPNPF